MQEHHALTWLQVRTTAARALGSLVRGLGHEHLEAMMPWLLATLSSESSSVERSGAALGLAEVVAVLGPDHLAAIVPGVVAGCRDRSPSVRDGNLTLLVHLPVTCRRDFEAHLETTVPCVLEGIADEAEEVRYFSCSGLGLVRLQLCCCRICLHRCK
jgi:hypothetical protein